MEASGKAAPSRYYDFIHRRQAASRIMGMTTELHSYRELVQNAMRQAADTRQPVVFENEGPQHAHIVIEAMLADSSATLDIAAGGLDREVWQAKSLQAFLDRSPHARVRVALDCDEPVVPEGSALHDLKRVDERIEVRHYPWPLDGHLFVADQKHVRLEYDKETREASVTFGDPNGTGRKASVLFEEMWSAAKPFA